ncbi:MAG: pilus assembly protein, partial [Aquificota bacterium]
LRNINLDEAERRLKPYTRPQTTIRKAYDFSALVITDTAKQMEAYERILQSFLTEKPSERKPVTKIFYLRYVSPDEFLRLIEPFRSEASVILSGGALRFEEQAPQQQAQQTQTQTTKAPTPILKEFNAVMITDYPEVIEEIKQRFKDYISDVPVRVQIEARIVEVRREALRELGINWSALFSQAQVQDSWSGGIGSGLGIGAIPNPTPGLSPTPGGIVLFSYQKGQLNALNLRLSALERVALAKSLAKPTIITINAQRATIRQGVQVPFQTAAVGAGGTAVPNIQFKDVVLELNVTPIVSPDDRVLLELELKRDTVGAQTAAGPAINTKEAKTKVIVENGQTVVIGGIIDTQDSNTTEGIPKLIRVPLLKYLFGQERISTQDSELLIFITPTVITQ